MNTNQVKKAAALVERLELLQYAAGKVLSMQADAVIGLHTQGEDFGFVLRFDKSDLLELLDQAEAIYLDRLDVLGVSL